MTAMMTDITVHGGVGLTQSCAADGGVGLCGELGRRAGVLPLKN